MYHGSVLFPVAWASEYIAANIMHWHWRKENENKINSRPHRIVVILTPTRVRTASAGALIMHQPAILDPVIVMKTAVNKTPIKKLDLDSYLKRRLKMSKCLYLLKSLLVWASAEFSQSNFSMVPYLTKIKFGGYFQAWM